MSSHIDYRISWFHGPYFYVEKKKQVQWLFLRWSYWAYEEQFFTYKEACDYIREAA